MVNRRCKVFCLHSIFLGFILFYSAHELRAQNKTYTSMCVYTFEYQPDSTNTASKKSEKMLLLLNDGFSVFKSQRLLLTDSVNMIPFGSGNMNANFRFMRSIHTDLKYDITKDAGQYITYTDRIDVNVFEYKEPRSIFNWTISTDTMTINDFHCQKATCNFGGRRWTAWFAPDISISDGPYKFSGLPGLIVKVSDSQEYFNFVLNTIENKRGILYLTDKPAAKVSKEKFIESRLYFLDNQVEVMAMRGSTSSDPDAVRANLQKRRLANNNDIERIP